ncbi:hypothetical protein R1sor_025641 [Riccia sorocarpa]|uniref:Uncharacterized protein n=1 Tax=Riccia sorocarpa TaxID=122646 RepID=A0ABD3G973_9MARC
MEEAINLAINLAHDYFENPNASTTPSVSTSNSSSGELRGSPPKCSRSRGERGVPSGHRDETSRRRRISFYRVRRTSISHLASGWDVFVKPCSPIAPLRVIQWSRERSKFVKSRGNNERLYKELRLAFGALQVFE